MSGAAEGLHPCQPPGPLLDGCVSGAGGGEHHRTMQWLLAHLLMLTLLSGSSLGH